MSGSITGLDDCPGQLALAEGHTLLVPGAAMPEGAEEPEVNGPCARQWCLEWPDSPHTVILPGHLHFLQ